MKLCEVVYTWSILQHHQLLLNHDEIQKSFVYNIFNGRSVRYGQVNLAPKYTNVLSYVGLYAYMYLLKVYSCAKVKSVKNRNGVDIKINR